MAPQDLTILGASGSGLDVIEAVEDLNRAAPRYRLAGILDDDPQKLGSLHCGVAVVGPLSDAAARAGLFVLAIASTRNRALRRLVCERLALAPERYATLIHPSASVSPRAKIGLGAVLLQNVVVGPHAEIGAHVLVCANTTIGHDARLGDFSVVAPGVGISGGVSVAACSYLGSGARLREGVAVGEGALVGIGAVVLGKVRDGETVFGNPARPAFAIR